MNLRKYFYMLAAFIFLSSFQVSGSEDFVICEGEYPQHLQDVCRSDDGENYFWSFTSVLAKTDRNGKVLKRIEVPGHHGGLTLRDGLLYVSVAYITDWSKGSDYCEVFVYNPEDLSFVKKYPFPDSPGIDGLVTTPKGFGVGVDKPCGLQEDPANPKEENLYNYLSEYTPDFKLIAKHAYKTGLTYAGVQSAKKFRDGYLLACYDNKFIQIDGDFNLVKIYEFDAGCGFVVIDDETIMKVSHFDVVKWEKYHARLDKVKIADLPEAKIEK